LVFTIIRVQDQYCFVFKAVLEGLTLGETALSVAGFLQRVSQLEEVNEMSGKTRLETEFEVRSAKGENG